MEEGHELGVVGVVTKHGILLYIDEVDSPTNHPHPDVRKYPNAQIKHVPVHICQQQDNYRQMIEVRVIQTSQLLIFLPTTDIQPLLHHQVHNNPNPHNNGRQSRYHLSSHQR